MIDKWLKQISDADSSSLILFLVAVSVLLSAWMQHIQHGWINPDSVLYFEQARLFALHDWEGVLKVYEWPFYGILIGLVHQLSSLNIHQSAQLLNILFFGISTGSFLYLIKLTGGNSRTILMGAALLFSSQYIVGDILEMLLRDEGFWAFYLSALVFFIRFAQYKHTQDALLWQVCIILATLFRIEGLVYLMLLPLLYFLQCSIPYKARLYQSLSSYSLCIAISIIITAILIFNPESNMSLFGRLDEVFTPDLFQKLTHKLSTQSIIMAEQVLGRYLNEFAIQGLLLTFLYVIVVKVLSATGVIATALSALGIAHVRQHTLATPRHILYITATISLLVALIIIMKVFVLSGRYLIPLAWVLLVFASFYLTKISETSHKKIRYIFIIICLALCFGFIKNILPKKEGYNYRQEAVAWAKSKSQHHEAIFYDDARMIYYASAPFSGKWDNNWSLTLSAIADNTIQNHELLLLSHSKKYPERINVIQEKLPEYKEVKRFYNGKRKKFIVVYALRN